MATTLFWKPLSATVITTAGSNDATIDVAVGVYTDAGKTQLLTTVHIQGNKNTSGADAVALATAAVLAVCQQRTAVTACNALVPTITGFAGGSVTG